MALSRKEIVFEVSATVIALVILAIVSFAAVALFTLAIKALR